MIWSSPQQTARLFFQHLYTRGSIIAENFSAGPVLVWLPDPDDFTNPGKKPSFSTDDASNEIIFINNHC